VALMTNKAKLKIADDVKLRDEITRDVNLLSQIDLTKWAVSCAKRTLPMLEEEFPKENSIVEGLKVIELWQEGTASVTEVREAGLRVHELARKCHSKTAKTAARALGHAISVGHMREHAMVATDYVILALGLAFSDDMDKITLERRWQLKELRNCLK